MSLNIVKGSLRFLQCPNLRSAHCLSHLSASHRSFHLTAVTSIAKMRPDLKNLYNLSDWVSSLEDYLLPNKTPVKLHYQSFSDNVAAQKPFVGFGYHFGDHDAEALLMKEVMYPNTWEKVDTVETKRWKYATSGIRLLVEGLYSDDNLLRKDTRFQLPKSHAMYSSREPLIGIIPANTPIPEELKLVRLREDAYTLGTSVPRTFEELRTLLNQFTMQYATWMNVGDYTALRKTEGRPLKPLEGQRLPSHAWSRSELDS